MLSLKNINYTVGHKEILKGISTSFEPGKFHVIVGPNGCGKSTLMKVISGELQPQSGQVEYDSTDVFKIGKKELAKYRAVMSQQPELHFPLTIEEVVMMGRYPHFNYRHSQKDEEICMQAMQRMDIADLLGRDYLTLSGGEKQRVQFARVLSQIWEAKENQTRYLFLDEAVAHLDLKHQQQLLKITKELCNNGVLVVAILHDLNLALEYAEHMVLMKHGNICYELPKPARMISPEIIKEIFEVDSQLIPLPGNKTTIVFPS